MWLATFTIALVTLAGGCVAARPVPYAPQPMEAYNNVQTKDGLTMAVRPILDMEESAKHFGDALQANNIVAAYISVANRHPTQHFVVSREGILLSGAAPFEAPSSPGGNPAAAPPKSSASDVAGGAAGVGILLGYTPAMLGVLAAAPFVVAAEDSRRHAQLLNYDLRGQEFRTRTLKPGEAAGGFVYFRLPTGGALPPQWTIQINVSPAGSAQTSRFEFAFGAQRNEP
jgi:hypothetical protein